MLRLKWIMGLVAVPLAMGCGSEAPTEGSQDGPTGSLQITVAPAEAAQSPEYCAIGSATYTATVRSQVNGNWEVFNTYEITSSDGDGGSAFHLGACEGTDDPNAPRYTWVTVSVDALSCVDGTPITDYKATPTDDFFYCQTEDDNPSAHQPVILRRLLLGTTDLTIDIEDYVWGVKAGAEQSLMFSQCAEVSQRVPTLIHSFYFQPKDGYQAFQELTLSCQDAVGNELEVPKELAMERFSEDPLGVDNSHVDHLAVECTRCNIPEEATNCTMIVTSGQVPVEQIDGKMALARSGVYRQIEATAVYQIPIEEGEFACDSSKVTVDKQIVRPAVYNVALDSDATWVKSRRVAYNLTLSGIDPSYKKMAWEGQVYSMDTTEPAWACQFGQDPDCEAIRSYYTVSCDENNIAAKGCLGDTTTQTYNDCGSCTNTIANVFGAGIEDTDLGMVGESIQALYKEINATYHKLRNDFITFSAQFMASQDALNDLLVAKEMNASYTSKLQAQVAALQKSLGETGFADPNDPTYEVDPAQFCHEYAWLQSELLNTKAFYDAQQYAAATSSLQAIIQEVNLRKKTNYAILQDASVKAQPDFDAYYTQERVVMALNPELIQSRYEQAATAKTAVEKVNVDELNMPLVTALNASEDKDDPFGGSTYDDIDAACQTLYEQEMKVSDSFSPLFEDISKDFDIVGQYFTDTETKIGEDIAKAEGELCALDTSYSNNCDTSIGAGALIDAKAAREDGLATYNEYIGEVMDQYSGRPGIITTIKNRIIGDGSLSQEEPLLATFNRVDAYAILAACLATPTTTVLTLGGKDDSVLNMKMTLYDEVNGAPDAKTGTPCCLKDDASTDETCTDTGAAECEDGYSFGNSLQDASVLGLLHGVKMRHEGLEYQQKYDEAATYKALLSEQ